MTIKELKSVIKELDDDMNVFIEFYDGWDFWKCSVKQFDVSTEFGSDGYGLNRDCLYLYAEKSY